VVEGEQRVVKKTSDKKADKPAKAAAVKKETK
jgi:hypothetical protein